MQPNSQIKFNGLTDFGKTFLVICLLFSVADVNSAAPRLAKTLSDTFHRKAIVGYRPLGVPKTWTVTPSKKGSGWQYTNPHNNHTNVRVMPGQKSSPFPAQQRPYAVGKIDGNYINKEGYTLQGKQPGKAAEAHVPLLDFRWPTRR